MTLKELIDVLPIMPKETKYVTPYIVHICDNDSVKAALKVNRAGAANMKDLDPYIDKEIVKITPDHHISGSMIINGLYVDLKT